MKQLEPVHYANASIVQKPNKNYKETREVKFQWLYQHDIGTRNFNSLVYRCTSRIRDYRCNIWENADDFDWYVHDAVIQKAKDLPRRDSVFIGKARPMGNLNERIGFTSMLLHKPEECDWYDATAYFNNHTVQLRLHIQNNKLYPYKGEWRNELSQTMSGVTYL